MAKQLTSLQHPLVKHLVKLRQNSDYRYDHNVVLIEGPKIIQEIARKSPLKTIVALDESLIPSGVQSQEVVIVTEAILEKISGVHTPEGIVAEVDMPKDASLAGCKRLIALEGINDPGNLGTLLRTALALGWEGAFLLPDTCDPYNEKALRAARGATFRLPLARGSWEELKQLVATHKLQLLVADLDGVPPDQVKNKEGFLLVLGNEAHGPSHHATDLCQKVSIPMPGQMESLNVAVAGGILMYLLRNIP